MAVRDGSEAAPVHVGSVHALRPKKNQQQQQHQVQMRAQQPETGVPVRRVLAPDYGAPSSLMVQYRDVDAFVCDNGLVRLQRYAVNDNYCDCKDASDEPGTSACRNGRFFCKREGVSLRANTVNDGVCDCCDGSDEYDRQIPCPDNCNDLQAQRRQGEQEAREGAIRRQSYIEQARQAL